MSGATASSTGSLIAGAPGGMVTEGLPLKVSARSDPASIAAPSPESATCAAPTTSGAVPYSLEITTRTWLPPSDTRATWRIVWFQRLRGKLIGATKSGPQIGCGLADQVPIHSPSAASAAAGGAISAAASASAANEREKNPVLPNCHRTGARQTLLLWAH